MTKEVENKIDPQDWMQSEFLKEVIDSLGDARLVGGCVRDAFLKKEIKDIDIATSQTPENVQKILEEKQIKVVPTGIKHGTVTAVKAKESFEITTLRKDVACDGRHADVEFTNNWEEDAARRDFTMNALSMDLDGTIYDYHHGLEDAKAGVVKFVGDPYSRVKEDYLRILRYFRFEAIYGSHGLDNNSLKACADGASEILTLSGERIQQEMLKLLSAKDPYFILQQMRDAGVLEKVIPDSTKDLYLQSVRNLVQIEKEEGSVVPGMDAAIRLALLIQNGPEQAEKVCKLWKVSKAFKNQLMEILDPSFVIDDQMTEKEQKKTMVLMGKSAYLDRLIYLWAQDEEHENLIFYKNMLALANTWEIPEFPFRGKDVLDLGVEPGDRVGDLLNEAKEYWFEEDFSPNNEEITSFLRKKLK